MRRLLLDTHALLWVLEDDVALDESARSAIVDPDNDVFVSSISMWEISIKRSLGKLKAPEDLLSTVEASGFRELPVTFVHADQAGGLPPHHRDPFDRMLVAQAQVEGLTIVTHDSVIAKYGVRILAT
ncbi:MAG: type II toxin-antitoxin system VapC family toxin [Spirochaetaceae bacterium]|nr:type II toxin-antitoxin system VapC family toxin [Spirochaetaceae bacterium]